MLIENLRITFKRDFAGVSPLKTSVPADDDDSDTSSSDHPSRFGSRNPVPNPTKSSSSYTKESRDTTAYPPTSLPRRKQFADPVGIAHASHAHVPAHNQRDWETSTHYAYASSDARPQPSAELYSVYENDDLKGFKQTKRSNNRGIPAVNSESVLVKARFSSFVYIGALSALRIL